MSTQPLTPFLQQFLQDKAQPDTSVTQPQEPASGTPRITPFLKQFLTQQSQDSAPAQQSQLSQKLSQPKPAQNRPVAGIATIAGSAYDQKLNQIAQNVGMEPDWLRKVIAFESGGNPQAVNKQSGATGLIQFMPSTARGLGTSVDALRGMTKEQQLDYVAKYLAPYAGKIKTPADAYMSVFTPAAIGKGDAHVLYSQGTTAYAQNKGLDTNRDGRITVGEAAGRVFGKGLAQTQKPKEPELTPFLKQFLRPANFTDWANRQLKSPAPERVPETNFFGDVANAAINQATFNLVNQPTGHGIGANIGTALGGLANVGEVALALGALGVAPEVVLPAAGVVGGGLGFGSQNAREQLTNTGTINPLETIVATGAGAGLGLIPGSQAKGLVRPLITNVLRQGAGMAGAQGLIDIAGGRGLQPEALMQAGALGAGFGAAGTLFHGAFNKVAKAHPEIAAKIQAGEPVAPHETAAIQKLLTPDESAALVRGFRERGGYMGERPQPNLDARIIDAQGRPIETKTGRILTPFEAGLKRYREAEPVPQVNLLEGTALPKGRDLSPVAPEPGKAELSAQVFDKGLGDIETAQGLIDDAQQRALDGQNRMMADAKTGDPVEAQRIFGRRINELEQKASVTRLTDSERAELAFRRQTLDDMLQARRDLAQAEELKAQVESETIGKRSEVQAQNKGLVAETQVEPVPTEAAPRKGLIESPETRRGLQAGEPVIERPGLTKPNESPVLLDAQGRPMGEQPTQRGLILEGATKPNEAGLVDVSGGKLKAPERAAGPSVEGNAYRTEKGAEVYQHGRTPEQTQSIIDKIEQVKTNGTQEQLLSEQQAASLIDQKVKAGLLSAEEAQRQKDVLALALEAGRNGKELLLKRTELREGEGALGNRIKNREGFAIFGITSGPRSAQTEVLNLMRRYGGRDVHGAKIEAGFKQAGEQTVQHLRQIAYKYGITPTMTGTTAEANARNLVKQISAHPQGAMEFQDIYLRGHNFRTGGERTITDAPRSYPIRTITEANVGPNDVVIPEMAVFQNKIKAAHQELGVLSQDATLAPDVRKSLQSASEGRMTKADKVKIRQLLESSPEQLRKFCTVLGI